MHSRRYTNLTRRAVAALAIAASGFIVLASCQQDPVESSGKTTYTALLPAINTLPLRPQSATWKYGDDTGTGRLLGTGANLSVEIDLDSVPNGRTEISGIRAGVKAFICYFRDLNGSYWAAGENSTTDEGMVPGSTDAKVSIPTKIGSGFKEFAVGVYHAIAVTSDGRFMRIGSNDDQVSKIGWYGSPGTSVVSPDYTPIAIAAP